MFEYLLLVVLLFSTDCEFLTAGPSDLISDNPPSESSQSSSPLSNTSATSTWECDRNIFSSFFSPHLVLKATLDELSLRYLPIVVLVQLSKDHFCPVDSSVEVELFGEVEPAEYLDHLPESDRAGRVRVVHPEQPGQPLLQHLPGAWFDQAVQHVDVDAAILWQVEGRKDQVNDDGGLCWLDGFAEQLLQPRPGHAALLPLQLLLQLDQLASLHEQPSADGEWNGVCMRGRAWLVCIHPGADGDWGCVRGRAGD